MPKNSFADLYCRSCVQAEQAKTILEGAGFTKMRNAGGWADLQSRGQKVCAGLAAACN